MPAHDYAPPDAHTPFETMARTVCRGQVPQGIVSAAFRLYVRNGYLWSTEQCVLQALTDAGYIVNRCMYPKCGAWLGIVPGNGVAGVSHGVCDDCYAREFGALVKEKEGAGH